MNEAFPVRAEWPRLLMAADAGRVTALADALASRYDAQDLIHAESGLALLQLTDSALADAYFLGEIPLSRAHVRLIDEVGNVCEGAAAYMDDNAERVRALAVLDAALAAELPGAEAALSLLSEGQAQLNEQTALRHALLAHTRVDFALLGNADDEDDEREND